LTTDPFLTAVRAQLPAVDVLTRWHTVRAELAKTEADHKALAVRAAGIEAEKRDKRLYAEPPPEGVGPRLARLSADLEDVRAQQNWLAAAADQLRIVLGDTRRAAREAVESLARQEVNKLLDCVVRAKRWAFRDWAATKTVTEFLLYVVVLEEAQNVLRDGNGLVQEALALLDESPAPQSAAVAPAATPAAKAEPVDPHVAAVEAVKAQHQAALAGAAA
jgi:hypothetical protein